MIMIFSIEYEQEDDGRWLAEVLELPGALAYGRTVQEVISKVQALALRIVADKIEQGEVPPDMLDIKFAAA
jgi:predicted RNase H-like HicB family nuclease